METTTAAMILQSCYAAAPPPRPRLRPRCLVFEVERVFAAGSQMKENGEVLQSITMYYFVLHWSRRICEVSHFIHKFYPHGMADARQTQLGPRRFRRTSSSTSMPIRLTNIRLFYSFFSDADLMS